MRETRNSIFRYFFWGGIVASTKGEENFAEKIDKRRQKVPYPEILLHYTGKDVVRKITMRGLI